MILDSNDVTGLVFKNMIVLIWKELKIVQLHKIITSVDIADDRN